jgi:hypothetical protein
MDTLPRRVRDRTSSTLFIGMRQTNLKDAPCEDCPPALRVKPCRRHHLQTLAAA